MSQNGIQVLGDSWKSLDVTQLVIPCSYGREEPTPGCCGCYARAALSTCPCPSIALQPKSQTIWAGKLRFCPTISPLSFALVYSCPCCRQSFPSLPIGRNCWIFILSCLLTTQKLRLETDCSSTSQTLLIPQRVLLPSQLC